jgi:hypothetical protein
MLSLFMVITELLMLIAEQDIVLLVINGLNEQLAISQEREHGVLTRHGTIRNKTTQNEIVKPVAQFSGQSTSMLSSFFKS